MMKPPYPNAFEIIRVVANALDTKNASQLTGANKRLDTLSDGLRADYRQIYQLIEKTIVEPLRGCGLPEAVDAIEALLINAVEHYLTQFVGQVSMDGLSREQSIPLLLQTYFSRHIAHLLENLYAKFGGPHPTEFVRSTQKSTVSLVLTWLKTEDEEWSVYIQNAKEDARQRVAAWQRGTEIPSLQRIKSLGKPPELNHAKTLLLIARTVDFTRRGEHGKLLLDSVRERLCSMPSGKSSLERVREIQQAYQKRFEDSLSGIAHLQNGLMRTRRKENGEKQAFRSLLNNVRSVQIPMDTNSGVAHWIHWHEARWHIFAGELESACASYKQAFEDCLYRSGRQQAEIITEALVVAASLEKPEQDFLRQLKNAQITFGYDIPSVAEDRNEGKPGKQKRSDFVETWEITMWRKNFPKIFPKEGFFAETFSKTTEPPNEGFAITDIESIKPDFRYPDRKIKPRGIPVSQIIWFAEQENAIAVKELLDAGASVDVCSQTGDTPILMALEAMNLCRLPWSSLEDRIYQELVQYPHSPEIINKRTEITRRTPLLSAVQTGRLEVVRTVLKLGAEADLRGLDSRETPLNLCLKLIALIKNPTRYWTTHDEHGGMKPQANEELDSIRRHTGGILGMGLNDQRIFFEQNKNTELFKIFEQESKRLMTHRVTEETTLEELRSIAKLLLDYGSDPNAEHIRPLPGYTPLMLAAESDEGELFQCMISNHSGDPWKPYPHPLTGKSVDCQHIAQEFGALNVLQCITKPK